MYNTTNTYFNIWYSNKYFRLPSIEFHFPIFSPFTFSLFYHCDNSVNFHVYHKEPFFCLLLQFFPWKLLTGIFWQIWKRTHTYLMQRVSVLTDTCRSQDMGWMPCLLLFWLWWQPCMSIHSLSERSMMILSSVIPWC